MNIDPKRAKYVDLDKLCQDDYEFVTHTGVYADDVKEGATMANEELYKACEEAYKQALIVEYNDLINLISTSLPSQAEKATSASKLMLESGAIEHYGMSLFVTAQKLYAAEHKSRLGTPCLLADKPGKKVILESDAIGDAKWTVIILPGMGTSAHVEFTTYSIALQAWNDAVGLE